MKNKKDDNIRLASMYPIEDVSYNYFETQNLQRQLNSHFASWWLAFKQPVRHELSTPIATYLETFVLTYLMVR